MTDIKSDVEIEKIANLIPYSNNPKAHPEEQIDKIASSIKNYGFDQPIVVDSEKEIIKGHGRLEAARKLGLEEVPVIEQDDLTKAQVKAARLADNKSAESEWLDEELSVELEELEEMDVELEKTGFDEDEVEGLSENVDSIEKEEKFYTDKIESPNYKPTGREPDIEELTDQEKFEELIAKIKDKDLNRDIQEFLELAAYRHIKFDYENIAEFYAHANPKVQELMEDLALVIIDFDKALEEGFVEFNENVLRSEDNER